MNRHEFISIQLVIYIQNSNGLLRALQVVESMLHVIDVGIIYFW